MRKITRLYLVAGAYIAVIGGAMAAVPSSAATGGGECELSGTANFNPGPGTNPSGAFAYNFSGKLSNCGDSTGGPSGFGSITGTISAGQTYTDPTGATHAEPASTGTGSCATGTTSGVSFVNWSDKTTTIIQYTTTSAAAGVALQGTVLSSYKFADGYVATSTKYLGANALGALAFEVSDPTQCTTANGVTSESAT